MLCLPANYLDVSVQVLRLTLKGLCVRLSIDQGLNAISVSHPTGRTLPPLTVRCLMP